MKVAAAADMAPWAGAENEWIDEIRPLLSSSDPQVRVKAAVLLAPYDNAGAEDAADAAAGSESRDPRAGRRIDGVTSRRRLRDAAPTATQSRSVIERQGRGADPRLDEVAGRITARRTCDATRLNIDVS